MDVDLWRSVLRDRRGPSDVTPRAGGGRSTRTFRYGERQAFGVALALSKTGHFDWEDFRHKLIAAIGEWEDTHSLDELSWSYYERWLTAVTAEDLAAYLPGRPESGTAPSDGQLPT
jgi:nitrile hydratase accessory protein